MVGYKWGEVYQVCAITCISYQVLGKRSRGRPADSSFRYRATSSHTGQDASWYILELIRYQVLNRGLQGLQAPTSKKLFRPWLLHSVRASMLSSTLCDAFDAYIVYFCKPRRCDRLKLQHSDWFTYSAPSESKNYVCMMRCKWHLNLQICQHEMSFEESAYSSQGRRKYLTIKHTCIIEDIS